MCVLKATLFKCERESKLNIIFRSPYLGHIPTWTVRRAFRPCNSGSTSLVLSTTHRRLCEQRRPIVDLAVLAWRNPEVGSEFSPEGEIEALRANPSLVGRDSQAVLHSGLSSLEGVKWGATEFHAGVGPTVQTCSSRLGSDIH